ncbi:M16 family metallopeptidase [Arcticibacter tournemirensis]
MKKARKLLLFASLLFAVSNILAQPLQQDAKLVKGKLKNGFTYYIYPNNNPTNQSVLRLFVNAGSLQENENQQGLAHFVEHMAFNGTKHYSKNEVIQFLESKGVKFGADLNAHTSFDETVYKISINTEDNRNLKKAIDILADMAFNVTFDSLEIEKERGVVVEEWRSKQGASNRLREQYMPILFKGSRYAERMPIGKLDVLRNFKRETISEFYNKWYRPDLMAIAVVTNADRKIVEKYIRKEFGKIKVKDNSPRIYYSLPAHKDTLFSILTDKEATSVELSIFTKTEAFGSTATEQDFQLYLQRMFLNNLSKSRFNRISQLQNDFKDGSMSISTLVLKNGMIGSGVSLHNDQIIDGISSFLTEAERIYRYGFTAEEIERQKKEYLLQLKRAVEMENKTQSETYADEVKSDFYNGNTILTRQERYRLAQKLMPKIDSVVLLRYMQSFRKAENTVVLLTAPEKEVTNLPDEAMLRKMIAAVSKEPIRPWEDHVKIPEKLLVTEPEGGKVIAEKLIKDVGVTEWKLSNGTTVYLKPTTERKDFLMLSGFREGGIYAIDSSMYIPALFSKSVIGQSGVGEFSRRALSQYLTGNTASATLVLSGAREGVGASTDWKDVKTMFQLMYLKWTSPKVDSLAFEQVRRKGIEDTENSKLSPSYEYTKAIGQLLKGDEDYMSGVTSERIRKELRKEDILSAFNSRFGSAKGFQFIIVGDFKKEDIREYVEKYIGGLPAGTFREKYVYNGPTGGTKPKDILIYSGKAPKSTVNLFYQNNDIKFDEMNLLRQEVLQEVLKVKLRMNLREENSGVYGVGVSVSSTNKPNKLIRSRIMFTCAPESTDFLIKQAQSEVKKVAADPAYFVTELERIKVQLLDEYKKQSEKNSFWSSNLRNHFYYGFKNWDYFTGYEKMLSSITPQMISELAKKYLVETPCIKAVLMPENLKKTS